MSPLLVNGVPWPHDAQSPLNQGALVASFVASRPSGKPDVARNAAAAAVAADAEIMSRTGHKDVLRMWPFSTPGLPTTSYSLIGPG